MNIPTLILALAIGSFIFGLMLILFQHGKDASKKIPFWVPAKFLQAAGSLLLYFRQDLPPFMIIMAANGLLLTGCAYEGWAVWHITGRTVRRRLHLSATALIVAGCTAMLFLSPPNGLALHFLFHTLFYALPGWVLLREQEQRHSLLRTWLGCSFLLLAVLFLSRSLWAFFVPEQSHVFFGLFIYQIMLPAVYSMMLVSGFSILLLAKEKTDIELQEALREQRVILETLPVGLCILHDRIIERCNPAMERMFGFSPGTLTGRHSTCLYIDEEDYRNYGRTIYDQIAERNHFEGEIRCTRRNGERFWAWVEGASIFPERSQTYAVFSIIDITQQKMQQEMLISQKEALEQAQRSRDRFLQVISHEFRTPLGLLASSADIIDRYWERLTQAERNVQTVRVRSGVQQIDTLIDSIHSYNREEPEPLTSVPRPVEAAELCRTIASEAAAVWSRGHDFRLAIEECGQALIDENLFRRIVQNLLSNAFRYTEPQGAVTLTFKRLEDRFLLEVSDSGIGIGRQDLGHIYEEYFRGTNIGTRRGLGLGLSIVQDALKMLNGVIRAESRLGSGTIMTVEFPALPVEG